MQFLQQSNLHSVKAVSHSLKRTQKSHYCGNHDHGTPLDSNGFTYNSQKIKPLECQNLNIVFMSIPVIGKLSFSKFPE